MIPILAAFSVLFLALVSKVHKGLCRIDREAMKSFLKIMAMMTLIRVIGYFVGGGIPKAPVDHDVIRAILPISTLLVFWEDTFFTLPILIFEQYGISKCLRNILIIASSLVFASGHLAYGPTWAFCTLFYVPFISYRLGKKHGLGTVMLGHVLYDLITVLTLRLLG